MIYKTYCIEKCQTQFRLRDKSMQSIINIYLLIFILAISSSSSISMPNKNSTQCFVLKLADHISRISPYIDEHYVCYIPSTTHNGDGSICGWKLEEKPENLKETYRVAYKDIVGIINSKSFQSHSITAEQFKRLNGISLLASSASPSIDTKDEVLDWQYQSRRTP